MCNRMKAGYFFLLAILGLASCSNTASTNTRSTPQLNAVSAQPPSPSGCLPADQVRAKLFAMSEARSQTEHNTSKEPLLNESRVSAVCRASLIDSIVKTMDLPAADFRDKAVRFNVFRAGAEVLGELKAFEALDFLVAHLDFTSGVFSTTMSRQPAMQAVVEIGESAIPKLSDVLRQHQNPSMRMYAVHCISRIGGVSAVQALKDALPSESNHCVKGFLEAAIEALDNKRYKLLDNRKWFWAFMCTP